FSYAVRSVVSDRFRGNVAVGRASCGQSGAAGTGWCATTALAETDYTQALAGAACAGSKGAHCSFGYRASSASGQQTRTSGAQARARGFQSGRFGGGTVLTTAAAAATKNQAMAAAACYGTKGTNCRYAYNARVTDTVRKGGSTATAQAVGRNSGA